jgi:hypothetical protein
VRHDENKAIGRLANRQEAPLIIRVIGIVKSHCKGVAENGSRLSKTHSMFIQVASRFELVLFKLHAHSST